jgi:DNA-binding beta-propeller fold protein YncE
VGVVRVRATASNGVSTFIHLTFRSATFCAPQLVAMVRTGPSPREVALDTVGRRAFVAHYDGVTVIDMTTYQVITNVSSFSQTNGIAYDPDHNRIWATRGGNRVVVLDGTTYATLADLPAGSQPLSVAYNPTNGRVYVTNPGSNTVSLYRAADMVREAELGGFNDPRGLAVNPATNRVYVANHAVNGGVTMINGVTQGATHINTGLIDADMVAVDVSRNLVYVTAIAHGHMAIISDTTPVGVPVPVWGSDGKTEPLRAVVVNPAAGAAGHLFLVTSREDGGPDQLLLMDGWPVLGPAVPLGLWPYPLEGMAFDPVDSRVWVTNVDSWAVSVVQDGMPVCTP